MLVRQTQSHYGDMSPASELGLTVRTAAAREHREVAVYLLARKLKETGKRLHVKPRNERQEVPPRYPRARSNSFITNVQEH